MGKLRDVLKHAFAMDDGVADDALGPLPSTLERLAIKVVDKGLETPAIVLLESLLPLSFLGSQVAQAAMPFLKLLEIEDLQSTVDALEDRRTLKRLIARIEEMASCEKNPSR